jgi:UDP-N-acetylmuramoyl-tripeptide--D-alanyl-D-alanine ligase
VVVDCYNANPQSVEAALDLLEERRASGPRIAILGSMLELGTSSDEWHDRVLASALARGIDRIVATGEFAAAALRRSEAGADPQTSGSFPDSSPKSAGKSAAEPASDHQTRLDIQADPLEAGARLVDELEGRETVLLKGSRGVALERLLPLLEARFAEPRGG